MPGSDSKQQKVKGGVFQTSPKLDRKQMISKQPVSLSRAHPPVSAWKSARAKFQDKLLIAKMKRYKALKVWQSRCFDHVAAAVYLADRDAIESLLGPLTRPISTSFERENDRALREHLVLEAKVNLLSYLTEVMSDFDNVMVFISQSKLQSFDVTDQQVTLMRQEFLQGTSAHHAYFDVRNRNSLLNKMKSGLQQRGDYTRLQRKRLSEEERQLLMQRVKTVCQFIAEENQQQCKERYSKQFIEYQVAEPLPQQLMSQATGSTGASTTVSVTHLHMAQSAQTAAIKRNVIYPRLLWQQNSLAEDMKQCQEEIARCRTIRDLMQLRANYVRRLGCSKGQTRSGLLGKLSDSQEQIDERQMSFLEELENQQKQHKKKSILYFKKWLDKIPKGFLTSAQAESLSKFKKRLVLNEPLTPAEDKKLTNLLEEVVDTISNTVSREALKDHSDSAGHVLLSIAFSCYFATPLSDAKKRQQYYMIIELLFQAGACARIKYPAPIQLWKRSQFLQKMLGGEEKKKEGAAQYCTYYFAKRTIRADEKKAVEAGKKVVFEQQGKHWVAHFRKAGRKKTDPFTYARSVIKSSSDKDIIKKAVDNVQFGAKQQLCKATVQDAVALEFLIEVRGGMPLPRKIGFSLKISLPPKLEAKERQSQAPVLKFDSYYRSCAPMDISPNTAIEKITSQMHWNLLKIELANIQRVSSPFANEMLDLLAQYVDEKLESLKGWRLFRRAFQGITHDRLLVVYQLMGAILNREVPCQSNSNSADLKLAVAEDGRDFLLLKALRCVKEKQMPDGVTHWPSTGFYFWMNDSLHKNLCKLLHRADQHLVLVEDGTQQDIRKFSEDLKEKEAQIAKKRSEVQASKIMVAKAEQERSQERKRRLAAEKEKSRERKERLKAEERIRQLEKKLAVLEQSRESNVVQRPPVAVQREIRSHGTEVRETTQPKCRGARSSSTQYRQG